MKKFLVCAAVFAAMFLMVSCGGSDSGSTEDNSDCIKITPKWNAVYLDEGYQILLEGSYYPSTGVNPNYSDVIYFYVNYSGEPKNEYNLSSTIDAGVDVLEGWRESNYEETGHDNDWNRAYISVSGKVKISNYDYDNQHISVSLQNVRLQEATIDRDSEDAQWTIVRDGACLVIESSSFEQ